MYRLESNMDIGIVLNALKREIARAPHYPLKMTRRLKNSLQEYLDKERGRENYCQCKPRCPHCGRLQKGTTIIPRHTIKF